MKMFEAVGGLHRVASADNAHRIEAGELGVDLDPRPIFVRVNAEGVLELTMANGETVAEDVAAGEVLTVSPVQIGAGTTATVTVYW